MSKNILTYRIDYKFSQYYNDCDFINKFNLHSIYLKPILKRVIIELPLDIVLNSFISKTVASIQYVNLVGFLLLYITSGLIPFVNYNKFKIIKNVDHNAYCLKLGLTKQKEIANFLYDISEKLLLKNSSIEKTDKNNLLLTKVCRIDNFSELTTFIDKSIKNINIKELKFYLRFHFVNVAKINLDKRLIQNFPFFINK